MDFRGKDSLTCFVEAALIASVFILPSLTVGVDPTAPGGFLSAAKHLENLAGCVPQSLLLVYIIGLRGETCEFHLRPPRKRDLPIALILALLVAAASLGGAALAGRIFGPPAPQAAAAAAPDLPLYIFLPLLAASALAVGYREELLYRVYFIRRLELAGTPGWAAAALSAALFAAGHRYQGLPGLTAAALVGLVLGAAYLRTRNPHALAWSHAAYDVLAILSMTLRS